MATPLVDSWSMPIDAMTVDAMTVDAMTVDASPCGAPPTPSGCTPNGLMSLVLDAAWTMTGTERSPMTHQITEPFTRTVYLKQMGTGSCSFGIFSSPPPDGALLTAFSTATYAGYGWSTVGPNGHNPQHYSWTLCVRASDGALAYHEVYDAPWTASLIDAVLTRPEPP